MGKRSNFERRPARLRCDFADRLQQRILGKPAANAVKQASKSLRNLRVAEIVELDMQLDAKGRWKPIARRSGYRAEDQINAYS
jgi:dodecin